MHNSLRQLTLNEIIDRYEDALTAANWRDVDVRPFAPATSDENYWEVLVELLRIRMEHALSDGDGDSDDDSANAGGVADCVREFPDLHHHPEQLALLAFEEFRLRRAAGEAVSKDHYADLWNIDVSQWSIPAIGSPCERLLTQDDWNASQAKIDGSTSATNLRSHRATLTCGEIFGPFRILCELGSGALARVYLAQQLDLSARPVVLKVCARPTLEPQKIALLQHPHIVQIFSVHKVSGYQVLCLPYSGASTLADLANKLRPEPNGQSATLTSHELVTTLSNRQREVQTLVDDSQLQYAHGKELTLNQGLTWPPRWRTMSYEEIVCELIAQVARGLEHAHSLGIVHSDLKPANVLVGDDGQARLVDFNVAQQQSDNHPHIIGGTLPYMAPEHLRSLREDRWQAGPESDLYSLGVIAFQLLTGHLPFRSRMPGFTLANASGYSPDALESKYIGEQVMNEALDKSIRQRVEQQYSHRLTSHHASSDMRSIVSKMLEPNVDARYRSASDLCEDLDRHLQNRSLLHAASHSLQQRFIKWCRRHPRISSASSVTAVAIVCIVAVACLLMTYRQRWNQAIAHQILTDFRAQAPQALVAATSYRAFPELTDSAIESTQTLLESLRLSKEDSSTGKLNSGQLFYLDAAEKNEIAQQLFRLERALEASPAAASPALSVSSSPNHALATQVRNVAMKLVPGTQQSQTTPVNADGLSKAIEAYVDKRYENAIEALQASVSNQHSQPAAWLLLALCYVQTDQLDQADLALGTSLTLLPRQWAAWYFRGLTALQSAQASNRQSEYITADSYFTGALELRPNLIEANFNRGLCLERLGRDAEALTDTDRVLASGRYSVRAHFLKARLLDKIGDKVAAANNRQQALVSKPIDAHDYCDQAIERSKNDPNGAKRDLKRAYDMAPTDKNVLQNMAYLAMEVAHDEPLATEVLDRWVATDASAYAHASRGVLHARHKRTADALSDAQRALSLKPQPREIAQVASIYSMLSSQTTGKSDIARYQQQTIALLIRAIQLEWSLVSEISQDPDMAAVRGDLRFTKLLQTAAAMGKLPQLLVPQSDSTNSQ